MSQKDNQAAFIDAMWATFGNITESCEIAGIDRSLPYKWEKDDPEFATLFRDTNFKEYKLDIVESKLMKLAKEENPIVLIFLAKTLGKKRGYIEKQEIEHSGHVGITWSETKTYETKD